MFVNAVEIAIELSSGTRGEIAAGRVALGKIDGLVSAKESFVVETTLLGTWLAKRVSLLQQAGYEIRLFFVWIPSADVAIERVAIRVRFGGHAIPEATVRHRFVRGLNNLVRVFMPIVDSWCLYSNQNDIGPVLIASGGRNVTTIVEDRDNYEQIIGSAPNA
ncbi:MAG: hypothetical protein WAO58_10065 [Fimbriimonadaceae bacterium]